MDILRFITAGSVDDGKSTLIGRLLYDSKSIMADQLEILGKQSKNKTDGSIDLALLTDGLRAEREQGITIDVAYKYFSTPKRKFIIADAPGHIQYTRNMVTGASNADLAVILIDARHGVVEQTKRHAIIASLLDIRHVVVAVNKMDLVDYSQDIFNNIVIDFTTAANTLGFPDVTYFPISALDGDNIVGKSKNMSWYDGPSLLEHLESVEVATDINRNDARFSVQYVIRPQTAELHDYRGYAGKILGGSYQVGDRVVVLPQNIETKITEIEVGSEKVQEARAPQSVVLHLDSDLDVGRGDIIAKAGDLPLVTREFDVFLCWMDSKPLAVGNKYWFQINSNVVRSTVYALEYKLNVNSLEKESSPETVTLNDVVKATIRTASPVAVDSYKKLRAQGSGILIDETSHVTVGACMIQ
jgi:sulfate adenylyltransferase subunit 1